MYLLQEVIVESDLCRKPKLRFQRRCHNRVDMDNVGGEREIPVRWAKLPHQAINSRHPGKMMECSKHRESGGREGPCPNMPLHVYLSVATTCHHSLYELDQLYG